MESTYDYIGFAGFVIKEKSLGGGVSFLS